MGAVPVARLSSHVEHVACGLVLLSSFVASVLFPSGITMIDQYIRNSSNTLPIRKYVNS